MRGTAREKLLEAAESLARDIGPGHMTLESVARHAGVSKGGLLYHFPSKAHLLEALVERYVALFDAATRERMVHDTPVTGDLIAAYISQFVHEQQLTKPPSSSLMTALVENPTLLDPVRSYHRDLLDRMKDDNPDPAVALVVFLVLGGIRSMEMLNIDALHPDEFSTVIDFLRRITKPAAFPA